MERALVKEEIRVTVDSRNERLEKKIRDAELEKVPYMIVVGEKEAKTGSISLRSKGKKTSEILILGDFISRVKREIEEKR